MRFINKRKLILIVICVLLGLVVAYQETVYFRAKQVQFVPVIVLKEDLSVNTVLTKGALEYRDYPKNIINDQFILKMEDAIDKYVVRNAKAGTPLFVSDLSTKQSVVVPEGKVRIAFSTNLPDAIAGAITPGSFVNIGSVSQEDMNAKLLFSNVQIARITDKSGVELNNGNALLLSNKFAKDEKLPATITVILSPDESVILKQHEAQGRVFIMGK